MEECSATLPLLQTAEDKDGEEFHDFAVCIYQTNLWLLEQQVSSEA